MKKKYYSNSEGFINVDNLELLFAYVKQYKVLKNCQLNLNAKYKFKYNVKNVLEIWDNPSYIQLYDKTINLKILCGENGSGKTTIINSFKYDIIDTSPNFVLFKTSDGKFYTNKKGLKIKYNNKEFDCCYEKAYSHRTGQLSIYKSTDIEELEDFKEKFIYSYLKFNDLYEINEVCKPLFNKFEIETSSFISSLVHEIQFDLPQKLKLSTQIINHTSIDEFHNYLKEKPFQFMFIYNSLDNTFEHYYESLSSEYNFDEETSISEIFDNIISYTFNSTSQIEKFNKKIKGIIFSKTPKTKRKKLGKVGVLDIVQEYKTSNIYKQKMYDLNMQTLKIIRTKLQAVSKAMHNYICDTIPYLKEPTNLWADENFIFDFLSFSPFKFIDRNESIYFYNLSSGVQLKLQLTYELILKLIQQGQNSTMIYEDEVDCHLHPKWSQSFISLYLSIYKAIMNSSYIIDKQKIHNIIMTTHSPFILSDTNNDYIEYLKRDELYSNIYKDEEKPIQPFAGNIGEMFNKNFFMNSSIGAYSKTVLEKIVKSIDNNDISENKLYDIETCEKIINTIGDKLLRNLLLEKLQGSNWYKNEKNSNREI